MPQTPQTSPPSCIKPQQTPNLDTLLKWCERNNFVLHPTPLVEAATGVKLLCFAERYDRRKEHKGKNNVIATYLTSRIKSGLAPRTIIGRAVFVRMDPENEDRPVDLDRNEFLRLLFCINDLMVAYEYGGLVNVETMVKDVRKCYPFYDPLEKNER